MSKAFIVEVDEVAAGLAVREPDGFRFYATDRQFSGMEGKLFGSPKAAERAAAQIAGRRRATQGVTIARRLTPGLTPAA